MRLINRLNAYLRHDTTTGVQLREMDALRGWACLGVVMFHCVRLLGKSAASTNVYFAALLSPLRIGWLGVDVFFFISGFLLQLKFAKAYMEGRPRPALGSFYKRRFLRIAPAYYASVLILVALYALSVTRSPSLANRGLADVLTHFAFVHNLFPEYEQSIDVVYWTLAVEFQFYLVLPFMAGWFHGKRWKYGLAAVLVCVLALELVLQFTVWPAYAKDFGGLRELLDGVLFWRLEQFAIGMCFCELWLRWNSGRLPNPFSGRAWLGDLTALVSAALLLFTGMWTEGGGAGFVNAFILYVFPKLTVVLAGLVLFGLLYGKYMKKVLANPVIELFGIISYSAYIWHFVVIVELTRGFKDLRGSMGIIQLGGLAVGTLTAVFVVSLLSYMLFERPFLKRSFLFAWLYRGRKV